MTLQLPQPQPAPSRPLSILTTGTSATMADKTGDAWRGAVDRHSCWEDLILTLDGGGIRGYSSLLIVQRLMHEVALCERRLQLAEGPVPGSARRTFDEHDLLPCHYFDYIYGTSTGGLISVMLARLRMTVPQCLDIYRRVGHELFGHRRNILPLATKYHHKPLEKAVRDIVSQYCKLHPHCDGKDDHPWDWDPLDDPSPNPSATSTVNTASAYKTSQNPASIQPIDRICHDPSPNPSATSTVNTASTYKTSLNPAPIQPIDRICQSICLTATHNGQIDEAYLLRSYNHRYDQDILPPWVRPYNEGADKLKIWQVTRATSAAPFYFDMLIADVGKKRGFKGFKDGGIRENNPSYAAYSEHASLRGDDHEPALLLSVGTGRPNNNNDGFAAVWPGPLGKISLLQKWSEKFAVFKNVLIKYTEGEARHKTMRTIAKGEHRWYKRLNVDQGMEGLALDNWEKGPWFNIQTGEDKVVSGGKTLSRMEKATGDYLNRNHVETLDGVKEYQPPKIVLQQIAERLVRHRRLREETKNDNLKRWQTHMGQWLTGELKDEDSPCVPLARNPKAASPGSGPPTRGHA